ncbi:ras gtpase-activating protein ngap isoform x1 [Limosa lapponica baueri]|uniref:Ras gtpase-activating protein ngap isoform x1 n=1 Tax=Limosa lapponica baueri TaxID=1758121 RepID=A0A2I0TCM7_LIMLA|nr:ras gtpase-activating protein ngap isoform x1 [Limosa lapponica baueri]
MLGAEYDPSKADEYLAMVIDSSRQRDGMLLCQQAVKSCSDVANPLGSRVVAGPQSLMTHLSPGVVIAVEEVVLFFNSFVQLIDQLDDVKGPPTHRLSCGQSPYTETTTWERKYCILTDSQLVLLNREKEQASMYVKAKKSENIQNANRGVFNQGQRIVKTYIHCDKVYYLLVLVTENSSRTSLMYFPTLASLVTDTSSGVTAVIPRENGKSRH